MREQILYRYGFHVGWYGPIYRIQKKVWYGWKTVFRTPYPEDIVEEIKKLTELGHTVANHNL